MSLETGGRRDGIGSATGKQSRTASNYATKTGKTASVDAGLSVFPQFPKSQWKWWNKTSKKGSRWGSFSDPGEQNPQRMRRLSSIFSFLNTVESTVIKAEIVHRSRVQSGPSCRRLMFRLRHMTQRICVSVRAQTCIWS
jgi:hypothetical protein